MKLKFTRQEFLALWRTLRGYAPLRDDVSLTRSDGLDFDRRLEAEMDYWYRRLLAEGDEAMLVPEELAGDVTPEADDDGCLSVELPPGAVRVLMVKLSGWCTPATVVTDPECNMALRQLHPYTRACASAPVAVLHPDRRLALYPSTPSDTLATLQCAMLHDDEFTIDSSALHTVNEINV